MKLVDRIKKSINDLFAEDFTACPYCETKMKEFAIVDFSYNSYSHLKEVKRDEERPEFFIEIDPKDPCIETIFVCPKCGVMKANIYGM